MSALPSGFRLRLALVSTALVAVTTAMFGLGAFLFIRHDKVTRFEAAARSEVRLRLVLSAGDQTADLEELVSAFEQPGRAEALVITAGRVVSSDPDFTVDDIPAQLSNLSGEVELARTDVEGRSRLVVGARLPGADGTAYFFYDLGAVQEEIENVAWILFGSWLAVVLGALLVAGALARRTLSPVARAADAARAIAAGDFETRLPVRGDDEFATWSLAFNDMATAVQERIWREQRVNAGVAHELRTPLGAMITSASLLSEDLADLPDRARRPAALLVEEARRLRRLVDDLLELASLGTDHVSVSEEPVDLLARATHIVGSRRWTSVTVRGASTPVVTDARRVDRIVTNLIENALAHAGAPAEVEVGWDSNRAWIAVIDHGPGIPQEEQAHIFEPFHKGDPSRPGPGSGLGLTLALEHARALGGGIDLFSIPGDGARFTFWIPRSPE